MLYESYIPVSNIFFCGDLDLLHTLHPHKPNPFLFFFNKQHYIKELNITVYNIHEADYFPLSAGKTVSTSLYKMNRRARAK